MSTTGPQYQLSGSVKLEVRYSIVGDKISVGVTILPQWAISTV